MTKFMEDGDIVLRPVEKDDVEFLRDLVQHPDVRDTIGRPPKPVNKKQQEEEYVENIQDNNKAHFLIEYNGEKAGDTSLDGLEDQYRKSEFGISIHPDFHGKGIGTKVVQMLAEYAFETLNMHKFSGRYLEGNTASKRIMEKAGLVEEGRERHYKYVDGEWKDVIRMSILEGEYYE